MGPGAAVDVPHPCLRLGRVHARVPLAVQQAPAFVEHHPGEDGRMVEVAVKDGAPLSLVGGPRLFLRRPPEAGDVRHDQHAQLVQPIQPARVFSLDMQAHHVQPQPLDAPGFLAHVVVRRIGEMAQRMVRLVEHAVEIDGAAVERDVGKIAARRAHGGNFPHAEIGSHRILAQRQRAFVQERVVRRPQARVFQRQTERSGSARDGGGPGAARKGGGQHGSLRRVRACGQLHAPVPVGKETEILQICFRPRFQPHALPDTLDVAIALFAVGLP